MSSPPLVSVVVPAYNHELYVEQALRSVFEQDYEPLELIVLDDQSRDRTAAVIEAFLSRSDVKGRFRRAAFIANERNLGAHTTINRGIGECGGDYINILNSDDVFAEKRLSTLANVCLDDGAQLAFSRVEMIADVQASMQGEIDYFHAIQDSIGLFPTVGYAMLRNQCAISTGNLFFSRALSDRVGEFRSLRYCHDWDFILRSLLTTEPVFVRAPLYFYRLHPENSFLQLRSVAESETETVLRNYFFLCRNRPVANPLAPSPAWGPFFDSFVKASQYGKYLAKP